MGCVYLATNSVNGKRYVGWTIDFPNRKRMHKVLADRGDKPVFCRAIRKHGWGAFRWRILAWDDNENVLKGLEVRFIKELNTRLPHGYNMTAGGEGFRGTHTEETKAKMRDIALARPPDVRERIKTACAGNRPTAFVLEKSAEARRGVPLATEHKTKLSNRLKGRVVNPNTRKRMSDSARGRPKSEEHRRKLKEALLGRKNGPPSEETRQKIAESVKQSWLIRKDYQDRR